MCHRRLYWRSALVLAQVRMSYRPIGTCTCARSGRREKAFPGENFKCLKIGLCAVGCACVLMNSSGKYIYLFYIKNNICIIQK